MADYTPPPYNNIPFSFTSGGYSAPGATNMSYDFTPPYRNSDLQAAINVLQLGPESQTWQTQTYSYLKYCERYIVGFGSAGVQIITRRCYYGGIRDIGGFIKITTQSFKDLAASIIGEEGFESDQKDLPAAIGGHLPENLPGSIYGWQASDLAAFLNTMQQQDLPALLNPVPPKDLPAYLKVWPQTDIPGNIYGWQSSNLGGLLQVYQRRDLPAFAGGHLPAELPARIKGWVREAYRDLPASIGSFDYTGLPAIIGVSYLNDLPAYLYGIPPRDLIGIIHGWQAVDLPATINAEAYPYDLPAYIMGIFGRRDLPAYLNVMKATGVVGNLPASLKGYQTSDLSAFVTSLLAPDLRAYINAVGGASNLPASIYPKMIRLTAVLSVVTMEHKDLGATISVPCFYSDFKNLPAYLRTVFKKDLSAAIVGKKILTEYINLAATIGRADHYKVIDKIPISLNIAKIGYRVEDRIALYINMSRSALNLAASIIAVLQNRDIPAAINGIELTPYNFEAAHHRERVAEITRGVITDYQDVFVSFSDAVLDYYYTSGLATKIEKYNFWKTKVESHYSPTTSARLYRKIHKIKHLYDLRKFNSIDEAIRAAIDYVTLYPSSDISAYIRAKGSFTNLRSYINPLYVTSTYTELPCSITGVMSYPFKIVVGYDNDGVNYFQF